MKKILVIGASNLQVPAILKAKEMGFFVGVVDYNPNAMGVKYADKYYNISTIDQNGVLEAAQDFKADGIVTMATDMPMRSLAFACEKLKLNCISYETAINATDKGRMIEAFDKANVPHPWYYIINDKDDYDSVLPKLSFPLISKPVDNSGSRGVILVKNPKEMDEAYKYSSKNGRSGRIIIEEYMQGPEVSVEIVVVDGEPHILQITDKLTTGAPHFVEMGHSQPSSLSWQTQCDIKRVARLAVLAVGIANGVAHAEMIITDSGPKMVEIGARLGGDSITSHLVPLSTGVDMVRAMIEIACGEKPDIERKFTMGSAIRFFNAPNGVIKDIDGIDRAKMIPGVKDIIFTKKPGMISCNIGSSNDRIGSVISQANTAKEAIAICEEATSVISIHVDREVQK